MLIYPNKCKHLLTLSQLKKDCQHMRLDDKCFALHLIYLSFQNH